METLWWDKVHREFVKQRELIEEEMTINPPNCFSWVGCYWFIHSHSLAYI